MSYWWWWAYNYQIMSVTAYDFSNAVAFGHTKLWRPWASSSLFVISEMLWPSATTNYGDQRPQMATLWPLISTKNGQSCVAQSLEIIEQLRCGGCRCRCLWTNYSPVRHICIPMLTDPYVKIEWKKILPPSLRDVIKLYRIHFVTKFMKIILVFLIIFCKMGPKQDIV